MVLFEIKCKNWKAYDDVTIQFEKGINFIVGPNGSGKTSLLQAICLAFTGRVPEVGLVASYKDLIRDKNKDAHIRLGFIDNSHKRFIERTFSSRSTKKCCLLDETENVLYESNWDDMTRYIEEAYSVDSILFDSLIYMSEGEVYRNIHAPRKRTFTENVEELLGIHKLRSLQTILSKNSRVFDLKEQELRQQYEALIAMPLELISNIDETIEIKDKLVIKKGELERELKNLERKIWSYENIIKELADKKEYFEKNYSYIASLEIMIDSMSIKKEGLEEKIQNLQSLNLIYENSVKKNNDMLILLDGDLKICPLCKKTLSSIELSNIMVDIEEDKTNYLKLINKNQELLNDTNKEISGLLIELNKYKTIKDKNDDVVRYIKPFKTREEIIYELNNKNEDLTYYRNLFHENELNYDDVSKELESYENKIKLYQVDYESRKKYVYEEMVNSYRVKYLSDFLGNSIDVFLRSFRDNNLQNLTYKNIAMLWNNFKGTSDSKMMIDDSGIPRIIQGDRELSFAALSGGEKTAMLVMMRIIMLNLISPKLDYILLDEPLEHLDPKNRRSLIQFIVDTYKQKNMEQLIVTTTEKQLLNKYIFDESIQFINVNEGISFEGVHSSD